MTITSLNSGFELDSIETNPGHELDVALFKPETMVPGTVPELKDNVDVDVLLGRCLDLQYLFEDITKTRGMSKDLALSTESLMPGFLSDVRPIGYFTELPTKTQYNVTVEAISDQITTTLKKIWEAIKSYIAKAVAAFKDHLSNRQTKRSQKMAKFADRYVKTSDAVFHLLTIYKSFQEDPERFAQELVVKSRNIKNGPTKTGLIERISKIRPMNLEDFKKRYERSLVLKIYHDNSRRFPEMFKIATAYAAKLQGNPSKAAPQAAEWLEEADFKKMVDIFKEVQTLQPYAGTPDPDATPETLLHALVAGQELYGLVSHQTNTYQKFFSNLNSFNGAKFEDVYTSPATKELRQKQAAFTEVLHWLNRCLQFMLSYQFDYERLAFGVNHVLLSYELLVRKIEDEYDKLSDKSVLVDKQELRTHLPIDSTVRFSVEELAEEVDFELAMEEYDLAVESIETVISIEAIGEERSQLEKILATVKAFIEKIVAWFKKVIVKLNEPVQVRGSDAVYSNRHVINDVMQVAIKARAGDFSTITDSILAKAKDQAAKDALERAFGAMHMSVPKDEFFRNGHVSWLADHVETLRSFKKDRQETLAFVKRASSVYLKALNNDKTTVEEFESMLGLDEFMKQTQPFVDLQATQAEANRTISFKEGWGLYMKLRGEVIDHELTREEFAALQELQKKIPANTSQFDHNPDAVRVIRTLIKVVQRVQNMLNMVVRIEQIVRGMENTVRSFLYTYSTLCRLTVISMEQDKMSEGEIATFKKTFEYDNLMKLITRLDRLSYSKEELGPEENDDGFDLALEEINNIHRDLQLLSIETIDEGLSLEGIGSKVNEVSKKVWEALKRIYEKIVNWLKEFFKSQHTKNLEEVEKLRQEMANHGDVVSKMFEEILISHKAYNFSGDLEIDVLNKRVKEAKSYLEAVDIFTAGMYVRAIEPFTRYINARPWAIALFVEPELLKKEFPIHKYALDHFSVNFEPDTIRGHIKLERKFEEIKAQEAELFGGKTAAEFVADIRSKLDDLKTRGVEIKDVIEDTRKAILNKAAIVDVFSESSARAVLESMNRAIKAGSDLGDRRVVRELSLTASNLSFLLYEGLKRMDVVKDITMELGNIIYKFSKGLKEISADFPNVPFQDKLAIEMKYSKFSDIEKTLGSLRRGW